MMLLFLWICSGDPAGDRNIFTKMNHTIVKKGKKVSGMDDQTIKLLEECSKGCKMGIDSIGQVQDFITEDEKLKKVIDRYHEKYQILDEETSRLLKQAGEPDKEPGMMAAAFSWMTTEMKLMLKGDSRQVARLMMDGCNMGIKSISEALNDNRGASEQAKTIARKLVKDLEEFMKDIKEFL